MGVIHRHRSPHRPIIDVVFNRARGIVVSLLPRDRDEAALAREHLLGIGHPESLFRRVEGWGFAQVRLKSGIRNNFLSDQEVRFAGFGDGLAEARLHQVIRAIIWGACHSGSANIPAEDGHSGWLR
jgi:hypothetical protein